MNVWLNKWKDEKHKSYKFSNYKILDGFLKHKPKKILDIGCGLAYESELFQKNYASELYLLDGDFNHTKNNSRYVGYAKIDDFKFYNTVKDLKNSLDERKINYNFIDANNINLQDNIKFDLVYSILSCGFHYPIETYKNLIKKHTDKSSIIIMDIRHKVLNEEQKSFKVLKVLESYKKYKTVQIELFD